MINELSLSTGQDANEISWKTYKYSSILSVYLSQKETLEKFKGRNNKD